MQPVGEEQTYWKHNGVVFTDRRVRAGIYAVITAFHSFTISSTRSLHTHTLFFFSFVLVTSFFTPWPASNYMVTGVSVSPLDISHDFHKANRCWLRVAMEAAPCFPSCLAFFASFSSSMPDDPSLSFPLPFTSYFTHSLPLSLPGTSHIHLPHFSSISLSVFPSLVGSPAPTQDNMRA